MLQSEHLRYWRHTWRYQERSVTLGTLNTVVFIILIPAAVIKTHFSKDSNLIEVMSTAWFSYATTLLQATIISHLMEQGLTLEEATKYCAEEIFRAGFVIFTLSHINNDPLSRLMGDGLMKICADCVLSAIKRHCCPKAMVMRETMEFVIDGTLYAYTTYLVMESKSLLLKIFLEKNAYVYYFLPRDTLY